MKVMTENLKYIDIDPTAAGKLAQQLHIKKEEIPFIRKSFLAEKQEGNAKERSVVSYISTGIKDRDNEALLPGGVKLENYRKNPVVMWGHDYTNLPVGKNLWIKKDEHGLVAKTLFAKSKRGEELFKAYSEDIEGTGPLLKGWSVGFIPVKWEDAEKKDGEKASDDVPRRVYTEWELLEYSAVPIPSCPEALTLAVEKNLVPDFLKKDLVGEKEPITEEEKTVIKAAGKVLVEELRGSIIKEALLKPETTEKFHRIPVNPGCEVTATITISASQGIKAIYCGKIKKVHTYLFDVNKWTMAEAKKWVEDHKDADGYYQEIIDGHMKGLEMMAFEPEEKEGRVLSARNRALLSAVIKAIEEAIPPLKDLLKATEPDEFGEREYEIVRDTANVPGVETDATAVEKRIDDALVKAIPKALEKGLLEKISLEIAKFQGKVK
jgi:HK97 family phage prohead protease